VYHYRISTVYTAANLNNPGGESLPSDPFVIRVPNFNNTQVVLTWTAVPNAASYRIWRTAANASLSTIRQIATVTASPNPSYVDEGATVINPTDFHLTFGDLGKWHNVYNLTTPRYGHTCETIQSASVPNRTIFFSIFGYDGGGTLKRIEWIAVDTAPSGSQTILKGNDNYITPDFQINGNTIQPEQRMFHDTTLVEPGDSSLGDLGPSTWIWMNGGLTANPGGNALTTAQQLLFQYSDGPQGLGQLTPTIPRLTSGGVRTSSAKYGYCLVNGGNYLSELSGGTGTINDLKVIENQLSDPPPTINALAWTDSQFADFDNNVPGSGRRQWRCLHHGSYFYMSGGWEFSTGAGAVHDEMLTAMV